VLVEEILDRIQGLALQEKRSIKGMCVGFFTALLIAREGIKDVRYYFE